MVRFGRALVKRFDKRRDPADRIRTASRRAHLSGDVCASHVKSYGHAVVCDIEILEGENVRRYLYGAARKRKRDRVVRKRGYVVYGRTKETAPNEFRIEYGTAGRQLQLRRRPVLRIVESGPLRKVIDLQRSVF